MVRLCCVRVRGLRKVVIRPSIHIRPVVIGLILMPWRIFPSTKGNILSLSCFQRANHLIVIGNGRMLDGNGHTRAEAHKRRAPITTGIEILACAYVIKVHNSLILVWVINNRLNGITQPFVRRGVLPLRIHSKRDAGIHSQQSEKQYSFHNH